MNESKKNTNDKYAIEFEQLIEQEYTLRDRLFPQFSLKVSHLLMQSDLKSRKELISLYNDTYNINIFKNEPEFAYMYITLQVYSIEISSGYNHTILDIANTPHDFIQLIEQAKFFLWRIEFVNDEDSQNSLVDFIKAYDLSPCFIIKIMEISSFTSDIFPRLIDIFSENNMLIFEFHILKAMNELTPGTEDVLCLLASLSANIGRLDLASDYLSQITYPGTTTERIRKQYGL